MSNQEEVVELKNNSNNNNGSQINIATNLNTKDKNNDIKLKEQNVFDKENNNEQFDAFPTTINNSGGSKITKAANALNPRKVFRKRSSTESAVMFDSPRIQSRTRRYSKPLVESTLKNDKQNRLSKINEKRHTRLSQHILKYLQLCIEINGVKRFIITIEKQKTVEDLIHQIEAEYAFQFIFPKDKEPGELKKDFSEPLLTANQQFECNAVMNSDGEILKYSDIVGEIFDMFDTVVCTNVYEDRKEYEKNRILGFYGNYYKPDYELIQSKLDELKMKNEEDNSVNFNNLETNSYQILYQNNWLTHEITQSVILNNNDDLKNYMKTSERRIKEVKNMKLQKGKKLAKFFGEIVDVETLCKQVKKISKQEEDYKSDSTIDLTSIKSNNEKKSVQNIKNEFDQEERKRLIRKNEKLNNVLGEALTEKQIKDIIDVDKRRKRMKYLQHFLYSQIDDNEIINEIKIEQEKAMADIRYERRSNKLKKYFGQAPPPDLIDNKASMENTHRRSIISLTLLMSKENGIINLFNMINDIEKREDLLDNYNNKKDSTILQDDNSIINNRDVVNSVINEETDDISINSSKSKYSNNISNNSNIMIKIENCSDNNEIIEEDEDEDENYKTPMRKESDHTQHSIQDQNEIIYEYYETKNMEYLVEKNIFSTLEESINEDITDPETKEGFKRQLTYLRESFIKNSNNIRRMSQMNTSLIKDQSENIWKGSNLIKPMIDNETIVNRDYTDDNIAQNNS